MQADQFPEIATRRARGSILDAYTPYLHERWQAGCRNAVQLWHEIQARGFRGGRTIVNDYVRSLYQQLPEPRPRRRGRTGKTQPLPPPRRLGARTGAWLLSADPARLTPAQGELLERLCQAHPELDTAYRIAQEFTRLVRERKAERLDPWLTTAAACGIPEIRRFAAGIRRDLQAVHTALTSSFSNGQSEGQINRLKLIKRQMYGRAKFDLLRARVLARA